MAQAVFPANDNRHVTGDMLPMSELNTTPLIDVMLVLLIMFIITVPTQSHEVEMALPKPGTTVEVKLLKNELGLSAAGQLSWNDKPINDAQLAGALKAIASMDQQPEVHFTPDAAARYQRVDEVLGIAARSGADRFGFAGNEQYA
ncbi:MAG TPA: biopolymer transporter ExbD [Sphingomicrobium sp.]|nr:biopolymer transporter ExbD [Sphingomicrobium sp.]